MTKLIPTPEQNTCVAMIADNHVLKIVAGAGCSKTTTLSMVANATNVKSLYLAFNKAMVEEAKTKFPSWVTVKTTHGLAYSVFGVGIAHKLKRPLGKYVNVCGTGSEISRNFKIGPMHLDSGKTITAGGMGIAVKDTVNRFEYSAEKEITSKHVSFAPVGSLMQDKSFNRSEYEATVVAYARLLWKLRINPASPILATHDTYLKLYQLSKPDLSAYEVVYLDEAQDTNDCVIDIVSNLKSKIVLVGDPHQQIYSWRGSVNAMEKFDCALATLSTSFRFGQEIAHIANLILNSGNEVPTLTIKGWDKLTSVVEGFLETEAPHTRLYRTNAALVADGVSLILEGRSVALEIDVRDFVKVLESAMALQRGNLKEVKHENILPFPAWEDLLVEAKLIGGELGRVATLVGAGEAQGVLDVLSNYTKPLHPEIILTTAHKSKGREFDIVVLADDFPSCYNDAGEWVGLTEMERNLLYVAATRAKKLLVTNGTLRQIMERAKWNGSSLQVDVKAIVQFEPYMAAQDVEAQVEQTMMALGSGVITDLDRYLMPDLAACNMDGKELIFNELGEEESYG